MATSLTLPQNHPLARMQARRREIEQSPAFFIPSLTSKIDADTDAIYAAVIGNRGPEYTRAEAEATAFAAANFTGAAPPTVASWASAKGWTAQQAAQDILTQAAQWHGLQAAIRAQRLSAKEVIRNAATYEAASAAYQSWRTFVTSVTP